MEELVKQLIALNREAMFINDEIAKVKTKIEEMLPENGYKDESVTISRRAATTSKSIDLKALETKEPELYQDLLNDYCKTSVKKESVSYIFKKEK